MKNYLIAILSLAIGLGAIYARPADFDNGFVILDGQKTCTSARDYSLDNGKTDARPSGAINRGMCKVVTENAYLLKLRCSHGGKSGVMIYARTKEECRRAMGL